MPELPEVETVRRGLAPVMERMRIEAVEQRRPDLRFPFPDDFADRLSGRTVTALGRRAKYLLADLDSGDVLIMHLGMSGSFRIVAANGQSQPGGFQIPPGKDSAHDHVVFRLADGSAVIYNDPRRFGFMTLCRRRDLADHPYFAGLGPEPTGNALSAAYIADAFAGRKMPLKAALLDQRLIAGLGNIYVCEALWRANLSPRRIAGTLSARNGKPTRRAERLADAVRDVIAEAIQAGGSSLRDHIRTDGSLGYFQHAFAVYDREDDPCARDGCNGIIRRIMQSGRSTFFCPRCQR